MLHRPGASLSECLIQSTCRGTTHADMQLFMQLDQLLWLHRDKLHTQPVSYVAYRRVPGMYWAVKLVVHAQHFNTWNFCGSHPALSCSHLTDTHSIDLSESYRACWECIQLESSLWFLSRQRYSAKVAPTRYWILKSFSTWANLKCTCTFIFVRSI